jgi:hypothetical protein
MHTTSTRIRLADLPPANSGAPAGLFKTSHTGVPVTLTQARRSTNPSELTTRRSGPLTFSDMPVEIDLLWKGAHPLTEVVALLGIVAVVPLGWFGLLALAM